MRKKLEQTRQTPGINRPLYQNKNIMNITSNVILYYREKNSVPFCMISLTTLSNEAMISSKFLTLFNNKSTKTLE